jgi:hypothetical protein
LNTDMDSIASSIGAAFLFNGIAAAASKLNTETKVRQWLPTHYTLALSSRPSPPLPPYSLLSR